VSAAARRRLATELAALRAAVERAAENLRELEAHPTRRLLEVADLTGSSVAARRAADRDLLTAWTGQLALQAQLDRLAVVCPDGRVRRRQEGNVRALLAAATVVDPHSTDGGGPAPTLHTDRNGSDLRRVPDLLAESGAAYARVATYVARAAQVWSRSRGALSQASTELAAQTRLAAEASVPIPTMARAAADTLVLIAEQVGTDPLAIDDDEVDDAVRRAGDATAELCRRVEARGTLDRRVAQVAAAVTEAGHAVQEAARARREARRTVLEDGDLFARVSTTALLSRTTDLADLLRLTRAEADADRDRTERRLSDLAEYAAGLVADARSCRAASADAVLVRDRLRGRLTAFRAKASVLGVSDDEELEELHRGAVDELYRAPCRLPDAEERVGRYVAAIEALHRSAIAVPVCAPTRSGAARGVASGVPSSPTGGGTP
jgi:hypothetical protein